MTMEPEKQAESDDLRRQLKGTIELVKTLREIERDKSKLMEKRIDELEEQLMEFWIELKKLKAIPYRSAHPASGRTPLWTHLDRAS